MWTSERLLLTCCVPCSPAQPFIDANYQDPDSLSLLNRKVNSNLRGGPVANVYFNMDTPQYKILCDIKTNLGDIHIKDFPPELSSCIRHWLSENYNYTLEVKENTVNLFRASAVPLSTEILEHNKSSLPENTLPYFPMFQDLNFVSYQQRPKLSMATFVKPFDLMMWILPGFAGLTLVIISALTHFIITEEVQLPILNILTDIIGSACYQQVSSVKMKAFASEKWRVTDEMLRGIWLLWIIIMMVISNSYGGTIYAFITAGTEPKWPTTLSELLEDNTNFIAANNPIYLEPTENNFTTESLTIFILTEILKSAYSSDSKYDDIRNLRNRLKHTSTDISVIEDMILRNYLDGTSGKSSEVVVDNARYAKLSLVDFYWYKLDVHIKSLYPGILSASVIAISGIREETFWMVRKNFFSEYFADGVGGLEQGGFRHIYEEYLCKVPLCNVILSELKKWVVANNITSKINQNEYFHRCHKIVTMGITTSLSEGNAHIPLSWEHLGPVFLLYFSVVLVFFNLVSI